MAMLLGCVGAPSLAEEFDVPQQEAAAPAATDDGSPGGNAAPAAADDAPSGGDTAPASEKDEAPTAGDQASGDTDKTPAVGDTAPTGTGEMPAAGDAAPSATDDTPYAEDSASSDADETPEDTDCILYDTDEEPGDGAGSPDDEAGSLPEAFEGSVSAVLGNTDVIREGDTLDYRARVTGSRDLVTIRWQVETEDEKTHETVWKDIAEGDTFSLTASEENLAKKYRVALFDADGNLCACAVLTLPEISARPSTSTTGPPSPPSASERRQRDIKSGTAARAVLSDGKDVPAAPVPWITSGRRPDGAGRRIRTPARPFSFRLTYYL